MNQGDYVFAWMDELPLDVLYKFATNPNVTRLMNGSLWAVPVTGTELEPETDPFYQAWASQGAEEVERLNAVNPIAEGAPGYRKANQSFFQDVPPEYGSSKFISRLFFVRLPSVNFP